MRAQIMHGHILFMSRRLIEAGEELTLDYNFDDEDELVICSCGAGNCRGRINLREK